MTEPNVPGTDVPAGPAAQVDLLVVGGGINGAGIARDAAGRGLSVLLCERDDLAAHTSSASTKLIHGGLRYLEHREFGLVRKALQERERLLCSAPHIMWPLRFVMPHDPSMRPAWLIRAGLFLYDHLARRAFLPGSETVTLARHPAGEGLAPRYTRGFVYSDGWVDDARLVVLCARDAADRGAVVRVRTACVSARRADGRWQAVLRGIDGRTQSVRARALVNATGPWAASFLAEGLSRPPARALRLVRGSHMVLPRLFPHDYAYILQNDDRRIVFAIPYEHDFTLVGTTDVEHHGDPGEARIAGGELDYLCAMVGRAFGRTVGRADVVWHYSGVRPLLDDASGDPSAVTRDYALDLDDGEGVPLMTVWGGKITTFRKLAEEAVDRLLPALGERRPAWTADAVLPGGDLGSEGERSSLPEADFGRFLESVRIRHPWLPAGLAHRWSRAYGSRLGRIVGDADSLSALGEAIAPDVYEAELAYLMREEWAADADDVLWRRSKLGLRLSAGQRDAVARWMTGADARRFGGPPGAR